VQSAPVGPHDVIGIGHALLQLQGDRLVAAVDTGDVAFEVRDVSVHVADGKRLLADVSFTLPGKGLLAVVGPSGAGKSTLLRALTGSRPADVGEVRYAGRDLYAEYDELRHRIGSSRRTTCCTRSSPCSARCATPRGCGSPPTCPRPTGSGASPRCCTSWG
jgi:hypothetical protein